MKNLFIRARMIEDDDERDLVITDGVIADPDPVPGTEPDAAGWVLPGLADVHNHLSLASPAGDHPDADVRVRASAAAGRRSSVTTSARAGGSSLTGPWMSSPPRP